MADIFTRLLLNTNDFEAKLSKSKKEVGDMEGSFASVGKTAVAGFGAIAGAVGIAYGGMETFNKVVNSSDSMTDAWEATCRSAKSAVDEFFYSLSSGDFTFFDSGLSEIISKAKFAAGALDQLGNTKISFDYLSAGNRANFSEAITTIKDKTSTQKEISDAKGAALNAVQKQKNNAKALSRETTTAIKALLTEKNPLQAEDVSIEDLRRIAAIDLSENPAAVRANLAAEYKAYLSEIKNLDANKPKDFFSGMKDSTGNIIPKTDQEAYDRRKHALSVKYRKGVLFNSSLEKDGIEKLDFAFKTAAAADVARDEVTKWEKTYNKATQGGLKVNNSAKKPEKPAEAGSIDYLDEQIKKAQNAVNSATTDAMRTAAQKTLDGLSAQKLKITAELQVSTTPVEGSIDYIDAKLKKLQADFEAAGTPEARKSLHEQMNSLTGQKTQIANESMSKPAAGSIDYINEQISSAQATMSAATSDAARAAAQKLISELENQKIILTIEAKHGPIDEMSMDQKLKLDVPTPDVEQYRDALAAVDRTQKKMQTSTDGVATGFGTIGQLMSNIASTTSEDSSQWLTWGSNILSAVAGAIPAITALTVARESEATANAAAAVTGGAASVASIPVVGWILAGAAVAAIIASFASMPKFADGGLVGGSSYYGDKILAAVNSGEVILNNKQQRNLVGLMGGGTQHIDVSGELKVRGRNLVAVIEKNNKFKQRVK